MFIKVLILLGAILILLWWHSLNTAMQVLAERNSVPFDAKRSSWTGRLLLVVLALIVAIFWWPKPSKDASSEAIAAAPPPPVAARYTLDSLWLGPDTASIAGLEPQLAAQVRYGRELIASTAKYIGPKGSVGALTNGMNCQNCHLDAGTRPWGNNYGAVWSQYPKFRERSGTAETVVKRVNDCIERSLNGDALDSTGKEMQAILAYLQWVGTGVDKGKKPKGTGIIELAYLDRPADPVHGEQVYTAKCLSCHGPSGGGKKSMDRLTYEYPPLWGPDSYNIGAGLLRLSRFAGYVKANMPQTATWDRPQLTDEEAWDVAAYVNSQQRPHRDLSKDWPKTEGKPLDHPFGPYADAFPEEQHKYGPFGPIAEAKKKKP